MWAAEHSPANPKRESSSVPRLGLELLYPWQVQADLGKGAPSPVQHKGTDPALPTERIVLPAPAGKLPARGCEATLIPSDHVSTGAAGLAV